MTQGIEPVRSDRVVAEIVAQRNVLDPEPNDWQMGIDGELHFAKHLLRAVRMPGENQQHDLALLNRPGDLAREGAPGPHIPRRHPALDSALLQRAADRLRYLLVLRRVRNE